MEQGNSDFITQLYFDYQKRLIRIAYNLTHDLEMTEDLVQQTFLLAIFCKKKLAAHPEPGAWLTKTLKYLVKNGWRQAGARRETALDESWELMEREPDFPFAAVLPKNLSQGEQDVLIWRFEEGLSHREIAEKLNMGESACRMRVSRILKKCKKQLEKDAVI